MSANQLLFVSTKSDDSDLLASRFKENGIKFLQLENIQESGSRLSNSEFELILVDYDLMVQADRDDIGNLFKSARKTKFVIYNVTPDANRRIAFYRLGAYRILDQVSTPEDVYRFTVTALEKPESNGEMKEAKFSGSLDDFNLTGLINIFGKEKRSGILRIKTPVSSGKIYLNDGIIIHAVAGNRKSDDAVFYMLTWNKGWFSMSPLPLRSVQNRMQLSNIGLLLHGEYIRSQFFEKINKLGGLNRQIRVINKGDLLQRQTDPLFAELIANMSVFRGVHEIIEFSPYDMISTVDMLLSLKRTKNLEFRETAQGVDDLYVEEILDRTGQAGHFLNEEEIGRLRNLLNASEISNGKLIILGTNTCGKSDFIRNFNQGSLSGVRSNQELDFTKIELDKNFHLQVFGIALDKRLTDIIQKLSEGLLGYIFLVDAERPDEFEYTTYIMNNLMSTNAVPFTVAITNIAAGDKKKFKQISQKIRVPGNRDMLVCDVTRKEDVKKVILSIKMMKT
jgi:signal recognition particle receptor subunit beta